MGWRAGQNPGSRSKSAGRLARSGWDGLGCPAEKIVALIMGGEKLKRHRAKVIDEHDAERAVKMDSAFAAPSESDANPNHLEDFKRLVDVAARKRPQGDQT